MTHLVNRLTFELECPTEEQAFELRQKFSLGSQEQIAGIIDNVCSKYVTNNDWIRIDKLEIDLGEFNLSLFEQEFSKAFLKKFERIVAERISGHIKEKPEGTRENYDLELLEYFLLKGYLPWWGDENTIDTEEISRSVFKNRQAEISDFFRKNYNNNAVWERASYQLNDDVLAVLVQLFEELRYAQDILEAIFELISGELSTTEEGYRLIFTNELEQIRKISLNILVSNAPLIFAGTRDAQKIRSVLADMVLKNLVSLNSRPELQKAVINKLYEGKEEPLISAGDLSSDSAVYTSHDSFSESGIDIAGNIIAFKTGENEKERLIVRHAGIILLAPYLKTFFTKLGLLIENSWLNIDAQYRGLLLLKYLSSGITKTFEYQLILEKLLCGIPLEQPVPMEIILNDNEMEESEQLLKSVIEHWKVLKNTSVNGLRETFLKRDGIIMRTENGWLLQIERKTVDVLLESIPWGFSTIRMPWNEYLIITEW